MANQLLSSGNTLEVVAAADTEAGYFEFTAGSAVAMFYGAQGQQGGTILAGETTSVYVGGVTVLVDKDAPTDTYVQGALVYGDETAQTALTVGGDGTLGYAAKASINGDTQVEVRLIN